MSGSNSHPQITDWVKSAVDAERKRCVAICEGWIGTWQSQNPKAVSAQRWATEAIQDIAEMIESGAPYPPPTDTGSVT
jgi:hypothetical protein